MSKPGINITKDMVDEAIESLANKRYLPTFGNICSHIEKKYNKGESSIPFEGKLKLHWYLTMLHQGNQLEISSDVEYTIPRIMEVAQGKYETNRNKQ